MKVISPKSFARSSVYLLATEKDALQSKQEQSSCHSLFPFHPPIFSGL